MGGLQATFPRLTQLDALVQAMQAVQEKKASLLPALAGRWTGLPATEVSFGQRCLSVSESLTALVSLLADFLNTTCNPRT